MSQLNLGSLLAAARQGVAPCDNCGQQPDHPWHRGGGDVICLRYVPVVLPKVVA